MAMMSVSTLTGIDAERRSWSLRRVAEAISFPWLPLLPLLAIPFVGTSPAALERVIIAMQVTFLLMGVRRPVWVLGAVALSELTIRNHLFIMPAALIVPLPHLVRDATLGPRAKAMLVAAAAFGVLTTGTTFVVLNIGDVVTHVRSLAPDMAILLLIPLVIRNRRDVLDIGLVVVVIAIATAGVAIAQQVVGPRFLTVPHQTLVDTDGVDWGKRSLGLDLNPILLTDHVMLVLFPVIGVIFTRSRSKVTTAGLVVVAAVLVLALFSSGTRSWVLSAAGAILAMALVVRGRLRVELLVAVLVVAGGFWYVADNATGRYSLGFDSDGSAAARPVLWSAGLQMALDHPLIGVGPDQFEEISPRYASSISGNLLDNNNVGSALGRLSPHNDFLNVWLSFGTGALLLYALLFGFTARNFIRVARNANDPLLAGIAIGCLGALAAFAVNSFFHNLFTSALAFWILAGVSLALTKVTPPPTDVGVGDSQPAQTVAIDGGPTR